MITRGIVEKLLDRYTIKVRMPLLNRMKQNSSSILSDDLNEAVVSVPPNFDPNINVGDVVFVAFEDNNFGKPVVIGYLYRSNMTPTYGDIILNSINVKIAANLSADTTIGDVSSTNISYLKGVTSNIQGQLNSLKDSDTILSNAFVEWTKSGDPDKIVNAVSINDEKIETIAHVAPINFDENVFYGKLNEETGYLSRIYFKYLNYGGEISNVSELDSLQITDVGRFYKIKQKIIYDNISYYVGDYILLTNVDTKNVKYFTKINGSNIVPGDGINFIEDSAGLKISHYNSQGKGSENSGRTYIQSIEVDKFGHVINVGTGTETAENTHYTVDVQVENTNDPTVKFVENNSTSSEIKFVGKGSSVISGKDKEITIATDVKVEDIKQSEDVTIILDCRHFR